MTTPTRLPAPPPSPATAESGARASVGSDTHSGTEQLAPGHGDTVKL